MLLIGVVALLAALCAVGVSPDAHVPDSAALPVSCRAIQGYRPVKAKYLTGEATRRSEVVVDDPGAIVGGVF